MVRIFNRDHRSLERGEEDIKFFAKDWIPLKRGPGEKWAVPVNAKGRTGNR